MKQKVNPQFIQGQKIHKIAKIENTTFSKEKWVFSVLAIICIFWSYLFINFPFINLKINFTVTFSAFCSYFFFYKFSFYKFKKKIVHHIFSILPLIFSFYKFSFYKFKKEILKSHFRHFALIFSFYKFSFYRIKRKFYSHIFSILPLIFFLL